MKLSCFGLWSSCVSVWAFCSLFPARPQTTNMTNRPTPHTRAAFDITVQSAMTDCNDVSVHSFAPLIRKATASSVHYVTPAASPNQSISSTLSGHLSRRNQPSSTINSPIPTKQRFTGFPSAPVSPTKPIIATKKGSLRALDAAPPVKKEDDEQSQVSFGTAARRFAKKNTVVSPEKMGRSFVPAASRLPSLPKEEEKEETLVVPTTRRFSIGCASLVPTCPAETSSLSVAQVETAEPNRAARRGSMGNTNCFYDPRMAPTVPQTLQNCNELATSKVFLSRFNAAAAVIQKIARGKADRAVADQHRIIQQQNQAAARIQLLARLVIQDKFAMKNKAATKIQAFARGWGRRLTSQVCTLELQLQAIEENRVRELAAIEAWKAKEMIAIRMKYEEQAARTDAKARQNQETLDQANEIISYLRKSNARLRSKNETLRSAIDQLMAENKMLQEQSSKYDNFKELTDTMGKINSENSTIIRILAEFEGRKLCLEDAIEKRDDHIMFENRVGRLYLNAMQAIVLAVEDVCEDEELVFLVEEMCLQVDKCKGLEETERDFSESAL